MSFPRVCIVGGIYDQSDEYQKRHVYTPETVLAQGLRTLGVDVVECGHRHFVPSDDYDVVHVHHLGRAALAMATATCRSQFAFTSHDGKMVSGYRVTGKKMLAARFVASRADALVALSGIELHSMRALFPRQARKFRVISNGFPADVFFRIPTQAAMPRRDGPARLLFVGQLIPQKGVHVLLKALTILRGRGEIILQLVYQNPRLESRYREMVDDLGLAGRVHFLGIKSAWELAELYRSADLLVLPTFAEALPTVVTEAMMCGLPVVASAVAGIPEQLGGLGYLVLPGDETALAHAIDRALGDIEAGRVPNAKISSSAMERFSTQAMVEKHLALYRELIESGRAPERSRMVYRVVDRGSRLLLDTVGRGLVGRGLLN